MPTIQPREYSIASDHEPCSSRDGRNIAELLVQHHIGGRFSDKFLNSLERSAEFACKIRNSTHLDRIVRESHRPLVAFTTGSGIAPVRSLLQHRVRQRITQDAKDGCTTIIAAISLFAGFRGEDEALVREAVSAASDHGLFDILELTPSNARKVRAQDAMMKEGIRETLVKKVQGGALVFACAAPHAAEGFLKNLSNLLGQDARKALGDRYIADIYQPAT
jgi:sulfite reductase alpha subunit-like flavoprotein